MNVETEDKRSGRDGVSSSNSPSGFTPEGRGSDPGWRVRTILGIGIALVAPSLVAAQPCDAVISRVKVTDRDGDRDCDVVVKGSDPTPGDTFEVSLQSRSRIVSSNARGRWKAKFANVDGGTLIVTACGSHHQSFCAGFPPIQCDDILGYVTWCDGEAALNVIVHFRDHSHDGDSVRIGVTWPRGETGVAFDVPVIGNEARLVSPGWVHDLDVALLTPSGCFPAQRVFACGSPSGQWCEIELTADGEVWWGRCDKALCTMKKGARLCDFMGRVCNGVGDCPSESWVVIWQACWTDKDNGWLIGECTADAKYTGCNCPRQ
ncbi:MAG: hypothetical protein HS102_01660 [Planctomycetia bacterium]|nr:hypothetical protein [Planctomycetia bacterium]NUQ08789.1 hypothetical protein [Phycisphaerae bacterium]